MAMTKDKDDRRLRRHARVRAKVFGTSERPRLVVFRSLKHISAQIIDDVKQKTIVSASDVQLKAGKGSATVQRAKAVGQLIGKRAKEAKVTTVVFDRGGHAYHGQVKALADGAREEGLQF